MFRLLLSLTIVALALTGAFAQTEEKAETPTDPKSSQKGVDKARSKLVLDDEREIEAVGPVIRRDNMLWFHDDKGNPRSILQRRVVKVVPVDEAEPVSYSNADLASAGESEGKATRYTNSELKPLEETGDAAALTNEKLGEVAPQAPAPGPSTYSNEKLDELAGQEQPSTTYTNRQLPQSEPAPPEPGETTYDNTRLPSAAGGQELSFWRARRSRLERELESARVEERLADRLLTCIDQGIEPDSDKCLAEDDRKARDERMGGATPSETELREHLEETRSEISDLESKLSEAEAKLEQLAAQPAPETGSEAENGGGEASE